MGISNRLLTPCHTRLRRPPRRPFSYQGVSTRGVRHSPEFSHEKCSEIFPEVFEPLFCVATGEHWTGSPNKGIDQIGNSCQKMPFVVVLAPLDSFRTLFRYFFDRFGTFGRHSLFLGCPMICPSQVLWVRIQFSWLHASGVVRQHSILRRVLGKGSGKAVLRRGSDREGESRFFRIVCANVRLNSSIPSLFFGEVQEGDAGKGTGQKMS